MNNYLPFLDPYNTIGFGIDLLTGKPKVQPALQATQANMGAPMSPPGGTSVHYKQPAVMPPPEAVGPVADPVTGLLPEDAIVEVPQPGDPDYQPPGTVDGTDARPIVEATTGPTELQAPNTDGSMPPVAANDAYTPDSKSSESSLDLGSPTWGRFMSNPAASDALLAFGANMLAAPDFNSGLGAAGQAFGQALKPYESMSQAEKERLDYKEKLLAARARAKASSASGRPIKGPTTQRNGSLFTTMINPDGTTYEVETKGLRPEDQAENTEARREGWASANARDETFKLINEAPGRIATFDRALGLIDTGGVGSDWATQGVRKLALATGQDMYGINVKDASELDTYMSQIELDAAKAVKGQGQVTEFERKIIQASKGRIQSDPRALRNILTVLRNSESRRMEMGKAYDNWSRDPSNKTKTFFDFQRDWAEMIENDPRWNEGSYEGDVTSNFDTQSNSGGITAKQQSLIDKYGN